MQIKEHFLSIVTALLTGVMLAAFVLTQGVGAATPTSLSSDAMRTVTVIGQGAARATPDMAEVVIGTEITAPTPAGAVEQVNLVMEDVRAALLELGVSAADIQNSSLSLYPRGNGSPAEMGASENEIYFAARSMRVTIQDISRTDAILRAALEAGANTISQVKFAVKDPSAAEAAARQKAIIQAQDRADALAVLAGAQVGTVYQISETPLGSLLAAGSSTKRDEGEVLTNSPDYLDVSVQVQITYTLE